MRSLWNTGVLLIAMAIFTTGLTVIGPLPAAAGFGDGGSDTSQVIREGQIVEITDTTVRVKEWAGVYVYRLTPAGLQSLEANDIRVGDRVQFNAYSVWQVAIYFRKI